MKNMGWLRLIYRWGPALGMMTAIFLLSSIPSDELVNFGIFDYLVKKGAHMIGYGVLALALLRGVGGRSKRQVGLILLIVFLYAVSDEYHQSFVPGRFASPIDVLFDITGAAVALFTSRYNRVWRVVNFGIAQ